MSELHAFLESARLTGSKVTAVLEVLDDEDIHSVDVLRRCWSDIRGELTVNAVAAIEATLGAGSGQSSAEANEPSAGAAAAASSAIIAIVEVHLGERSERVRLSLTPGESANIDTGREAAAHITALRCSQRPSCAHMKSMDMVGGPDGLKKYVVAEKYAIVR